MASWGGLSEGVPTSFELIVSGILGQRSVLYNLHVVKIITGEGYGPFCVIGA